MVDSKRTRKQDETNEHDSLAPDMFNTRLTPGGYGRVESDIRRQASYQSRSRSKSSWLGISLLIAFIGIGIYYALPWIDPDGKVKAFYDRIVSSEDPWNPNILEVKTEVELELDRFDMAYSMGTHYILESIDFPESAVFPTIDQGRLVHVSQISDNRYKIESWVDVHTSDGDVERWNFVLTLSYDEESDYWTKESLLMSSSD